MSHDNTSDDFHGNQHYMHNQASYCSLYNCRTAVSNILDTGCASTLTQQELVPRRKKLDGEVVALSSYPLGTHHCMYRL